jgi:hypothetical protein
MFDHPGPSRPPQYNTWEQATPQQSMDRGIVANGNQANEDPSHSIDKIVVVILLMRRRYRHPQGAITNSRDEHPTPVLHTTREPDTIALVLGQTVESSIIPSTTAVTSTTASPQGSNPRSQFF